MAREIEPNIPILRLNYKKHIQILRDAGLNKQLETTHEALFWVQLSALTADYRADSLRELDELRGRVQSEPRIVLLASATSNFEELDDPRQAFFELFRQIVLKPLTNEECRSLWQAVTGNRVGTRDIRPLEILTGGNCRLLTIVAGFSEHRSLRQLMEELVRLVDDNTEYFRGHLEVLPKGERRVYIAVIDLWQPSSASEIAERARMDIRVASTMLGRLVERGAVLPQPKKRGISIQQRNRFTASTTSFGESGTRRRCREPYPVHDGRQFHAVRDIRPAPVRSKRSAYTAG